MKKSKKAVLLSALIFPGLGHVYLKKYVKGVALIGIALFATYLLLENAVESSLRIVENIQNGTQYSAEDFTSLVSQQSAEQSLLLNIAPMLLLACWLIAIIDSYRTGRKLDQIDQDKLTRKN